MTPNACAWPCRRVDDFDFSFGGAYSIYNWELFFHAPFMIAKRLSANRRFEEAHRWFRYIFDPTDPPPQPQPGPSLADWVWNIKPFVEHGQRQDHPATDAAARAPRD